MSQLTGVGGERLVGGVVIGRARLVELLEHRFVGRAVGREAELGGELLRRDQRVERGRGRQQQRIGGWGAARAAARSGAAGSAASGAGPPAGGRRWPPQASVTARNEQQDEPLHHVTPG